MKEYESKDIRNVALISHSSSGKTILTEAMLKFTGAISRLGRVEDGTTVSDFDDEEKRRTISLYTSVIPVEFDQKKINFLDTPGYTDFVGEMISALKVSDAAVILLDAVSGTEVGTEIAWKKANEFGLPRMLLVSKMNRENADFDKAIQSFRAFAKDAHLVKMQIPWGEQANIQGVIDILSMKAYGKDNKPVDIPEAYRAEAETLRAELMEAAAEGEDALMEKFFETMELSDDEIRRGFASGVKSGALVPILCSAANEGVGILPLLDAIQNLFPTPLEAKPVLALNKDDQEISVAIGEKGPLVAYVWKTTADPFVGKQTFLRVINGKMTSDARVWNSTRSFEERYGNLMIPCGKEMANVKTVSAGDICAVAKLTETVTGDTFSDKANPLRILPPAFPKALFRVSVHPKTQADSTKISATLTRLCEEDMTLHWANDPDTKETIMSGLGDQHIDVVIRRAEAKFQVNLLIREPKVSYKETITREGQAMYRHKKQSGGSGQFGEVHLRIKPNHESEFELTNDIFGGAISASYIPAIEKGIRNVMKEGVLAGFPIHSISVSVYDGKEHPVDSKPIAFETAGREAFKLAFAEAGPVLEEPICMAKIVVPEDNMGDIIGDLNTRRARIMGMDTDHGESTVTAMVPLAEMIRYTTQLRSMTGGRGTFDLEIQNYEVVPPHITQEVIAARAKDKKEE
ncbi:elongation factor G [Anaerolineaceae bacterium oral taxon 439]|nr:elongation factor G [Anaerolineaceae bacterium oral taxon 439]